MIRLPKSKHLPQPPPCGRLVTCACGFRWLASIHEERIGFAHCVKCGKVIELTEGA
jgi:hypothetical protein